MMRVRDFPSRSGVGPGWFDRLSVEGRCCRWQFSARRTAVVGLFRNVSCPRCGRRAMVVEAITDRDWSRWGGDLAQRRAGARRGRHERDAPAEVSA